MLCISLLIIHIIVDDIIQVNFASFETVTEAFSILMSKLQLNVKHSKFQAARSLCIAKADKSLKDQFEKANDFDDLFDVLARNNLYCNWMNVKFFKEIAIVSQNEQLEKLVKNYEDAVFSKTLQEVWNCIPHYEIRNKFYSQLQLVFNDENPNTITVRRLKQQCQSQLATDIALYVMDIWENCIIITYLISTNEVYQTFLSALTVPQESRLNGSLQIGAWMVYHPQSVLQELKKNHDFGWLPYMYFTFSLFQMHSYIHSCNACLVCAHANSHTYIFLNYVHPYVPGAAELTQICGGTIN